MAERIRTRLLSQVDERRSPRTRATVGQLLDRWLGVLDVDPSTRRTYEGYIRKHIRPLLGSLSLSQTAAWTCSTKWAPVLPGSGSSTTRTGTGQPEGVSEAVLEAMATALQLDQSECGHMFDVAKATSAPATPRRPPTPAIQRLRPTISGCRTPCRHPRFRTQRPARHPRHNALSQALTASRSNSHADLRT